MIARNIRYTPTFADFYNASVFFTRRRLRFIKWLSLVLLPLGSFIVVMNLIYPRQYSSQQLRSMIVYLWLPVFYFVVFPGLAYLGARRQWATVPAFREPREFRFDDQGIEVQASTFSTRCQWNLVPRVLRLGDLVLLETPSRSFLTLGRSAFESDGAFREFVIELEQQVARVKGVA